MVLSADMPGKEICDGVCDYERRQGEGAREDERPEERHPEQPVPEEPPVMFQSELRLGVLGNRIRIGQADTEHLKHWPEMLRQDP